MKYCEEYALTVSAFVDGELSEEEKSSVLAHIETCEGCRAYLAELMTMQAAFGDLEEYDAPEGFAVGVMERLHRESVPAKKRMPRRTWYTLAACAAVVILAASVFPRMGGRPTNETEADCCAESQTMMPTAEECVPAEEEYTNAYTSVQSDGAVFDNKMKTDEAAERAAEPETPFENIMETGNAAPEMPRSIVFVYGAAHEDYLIEEAASFDYYADGSVAGYDLPVEMLDEFLALLEEDGLKYDEAVCSGAVTFYVQYEEGEAENG